MQADESAKRSRRRLGCGGCLLAAVVLVVLVLAVTFFVCSSRWARQAEAELAQIRAAGEPTTPEELEVFYPTTRAERETARSWIIAVQPLQGKTFNSAAEGLPIVGSSEAEIPPPGKPWPDLQAAEKLLEQCEGSLRQLHAAAEAGRPARYPRDFSERIQGMPCLEYIQQFRAGARLLALEAHVRAHQGDARGAAESIHAILMLADSIKQEPATLTQVLRYPIDGMAHDVLQRQVLAVDFSDDDLDRLQAHLRAVDYSEGVHRAMMGTRVMGIMFIRDPSSFDPSGDSAIPAWGLLRNANLSVYLNYINRMVAATKRPWPRARRELAQIGRDGEAAVADGSRLSKVAHAYAALEVPAVEAFLGAAARGTASNRATDAVIAVERFRRGNGRLPEKLEELAPEFLPQVPIDPFDGQPLRYVVKDGEYVIYSVGRDGIDDGGEQGDERGEPDLLFPVELRQTEP